MFKQCGRYSLQKYTTIFEVYHTQYLLINLSFTVHIVFCFLLPAKETAFMIGYLW
jgi:hypothetical protein